jgi:hypothetical protein
MWKGRGEDMRMGGEGEMEEKNNGVIEEMLVVEFSAVIILFWHGNGIGV